MRSGIDLNIEELIALRSSAMARKLQHNKDIRTTQSGCLLSKIKGHGIDFDEVREYQFGDDIRSIDWKTSAKYQKTFSKTYKEERERPIFLLVDLDHSMFFGTRIAFKSVIASRLATLIAYLALEHQDRIGGVIYGANNHLEFKPKAGKAGIQALIKSLVHIHQSPRQETTEADNLSQALLRINRTIKPGSLLFVLSDFYQFSKNSQATLQQIGKHNDVVLNFIYDPIEKTPPKKGQYLINNGSIHRNLDSRQKTTKKQYEQLFSHKQSNLLSFCKANRQSLLSIATNDDLQQVLFDQLTI